MPKILLIEDEQVLVDVLEIRFTREGYDLKVAENGRRGLEAMKNDKPDLILLDILMPEMNGFEVLEEMNKDPDLREIPVVVISNSGQEVELEKAKDLGANDCIVKTNFNPQEVVNKVEQQLNLN